MKRPEDNYIGTFDSLDPGQLQDQIATDGLVFLDGIYEPEQLHELAYMLGGEVRCDHKQTDVDGITRTESKNPLAVDIPDTELNPHTDGTRVAKSADLLTLYCEQPAKYGGVSFFLGGAVMHRYLETNNPQLLDVLCQPWLFGTEEDGYTAPVFESRDNGLTTLRFRRDLFDNFTPEIRTEIDDMLVATSGLRVSTKLAAGQACVVNNKSMTHGRTAIDGDRVVVRANVDLTPELSDQLGFKV